MNKSFIFKVKSIADSDPRGLYLTPKGIENENVAIVQFLRYQPLYKAYSSLPRSPPLQSIQIFSGVQ